MSSDLNQLPDPMESGVLSLARSWGLVLAVGLVTIGFGIVLLAWPKQTVGVIAFLFGIYLLISGVVRIVLAFAPDLSGGGRALFALAGVVSLLLGVFLVKNILSYDSYDKAKAAGLLALFIALSWLISGLSDLFSGLSSPGTPGRGGRIFVGVVGIIAAIVVLAWPIKSLVVLAVVAGIWFIVIGLFEVFASFALRRQTREPVPGPGR